MSFSTFDSTIALCCGKNVVVYNIQDNTEKSVVLPEPEIIDKSNIKNNENIESSHALTSVKITNDGKYLLVCTNRKQLYLLRRESLDIVAYRTLIRAASRVNFTENNDVIVADKSGDVYLFSTSEPNKPGLLLLGHLSMLLDVFVTSDQKNIITADRDEKIRVSEFPNSYNITSYCLGHTKFVSNIAQVPHDPELLVSCGGDGKLIFWDYKNGKEIHSHLLQLKLEDIDVEKLYKILEDNNVDEPVMHLPVKHLQLLKLDSLSSIIAISFFSCGNLPIYTVSGCKNSNLSVNQLQTIQIGEEPLELILKESRLWILTREKFRVYYLKENIFSEDLENTKNIEKLNASWKRLRSDLFDTTLFPVLYKRKFDNLKEYQKRKKSRSMEDHQSND